MAVGLRDIDRRLEHEDAERDARNPSPEAESCKQAE